MNLAQLRFAHSVAATGSFTAAAAACFVTQPTLSNGIAQLEEELGERLFARTTRKVALTSFGAHLMPYIGSVLSAQAALVVQAESYLRPEKPLIRIGTSPLVSTEVLSLVMEPFKRQNPTVDIVLREMHMVDLFGMLTEGQLDFVFGVTGIQKGPLSRVSLYGEALWFVPRGRQWAGTGPVTIGAIASETFVMVPDGCGLARATRSLFRNHRRKLNEYSGEAMSYQVLEQWAALGVGAAILPNSKISSAAIPSARPIVDKAGQMASLEFEASWARPAEKYPHLLAFAAHLQRVAPALIGGMAATSRGKLRVAR